MFPFPQTSCLRTAHVLQHAPLFCLLYNLPHSPLSAVFILPRVAGPVPADAQGRACCRCASIFRPIMRVRRIGLKMEQGLLIFETFPISARPAGTGVLSGKQYRPLGSTSTISKPVIKMKKYAECIMQYPQMDGRGERLKNRNDYLA